MDKEFAGWSQRDIDAGIAKLVENIEDSADFDEDRHYKLDMANDILNVYFSNLYLDRDDQWFEIQKIMDKCILDWSIDAVNCNPEIYCEKIVPNDDL